MQLHILKNDITKTKLVDTPATEIQDGEVQVRVDRVGYSANNVTYAAAGDTLGYWKFFPTNEPDWGMVPVWGFADVVVSRCEGIEEGTRLFGYFPTATTLTLKPTGKRRGHFMDGSPHRAKLPAGYNLYRIVEPRDADAEDRHMLLFPLYITSWCLWDALQKAEWYGAQRIVIASASSKTAIGTAFAISQDPSSPKIFGLTSNRNKEFVTGLGLYDEVVSYDDIETLDASVPTVIVDMSGDASMIGHLHAHLGDQMKQTLDVGLTHWEAPRQDDARNKQRSTFFFAPSHIQARNEEWGADIFAQRTQDFLQAAIEDSKRWLEIDHLSGLSALADIHPQVAAGTSTASAGFVIDV